MKLASRISRISVSQTMAVNEKALQMRAQGIEIVDFGAGEPDFPTPENIKQAGSRAIESQFHAIHADRRYPGPEEGHRRAACADLWIEFS